MGIKEEKLKDYIKRQLDKGFSLDDINNRLINAGYSKEKVQKVIPAFKVEKGAKGFSRNKIIFVVIIFAVLVGTGFLLLNRGWLSKIIPSEEFREEGDEEPTYEELVAEACEHFRQNYKFYCMGAVTGDTTYCDMITPRGGYLNTYFANEGQMTKEVCESFINLAKEEVGYYGDITNLPCPSEEEMSELETPNAGIICRAINSKDHSLCEELDYETYEEVIMCQALVTKDTKYCDIIGERNDCQIFEGGGDINKE